MPLFLQALIPILLGLLGYILSQLAGIVDQITIATQILSFLSAILGCSYAVYRWRKALKNPLEDEGLPRYNEAFRELRQQIDELQRDLNEKEQLIARYRAKNLNADGDDV